MNQLILDSDYSSLVAAINTEMGLDLGAGLGDLRKIYAEGFEGCTTAVQRRDVGAMIQSVIVYDGKVGPLFGYWIAIPAGAGYRVLSFNINRDLDEVMGSLRWSGSGAL